MDSKNVEEYIKIYDPYFGIDDLDILTVILAHKPNIKVHIVTSFFQQRSDSLIPPFEEAYSQHWRCKLSSQDPPDTRIVIVGTKSNGAPPIHDRWWITKEGGLTLGTSYKSLGDGKDCAVNNLSASAPKTLEADIDRFLFTAVSEHNGERLKYNSFTLE